jgi:hypothetical protein
MKETTWEISYNEIKLHLKESGYDNINWTNLTRDRIQWQPSVGMEMNF